ncbi:MAG: molybdopterin-dependent oxidoreductase [Candidatus Caldarchaeum sp.]
MSQAVSLKRRDFLKVATTATTALSGFSLAGLSIQSARALPAPKPKLLEGQRIPSVCPYCAVGCTVVGTVVDGRVVDIAPDLEAPHTEGTLCSKGQASIMLLPQFNPYRLRRPLMRTNPRKGENEDPMWREITWEEAFRIIIEKYEQIYREWEKNKPWLDAKGNYLIPGGRNLDDPEKAWQLHPRALPIARISTDYLSNEEAYLGRKLAMLMGTNNCDIEARRCHSTTVAGLADVYGFGVMTNSAVDMQNAKVTINIGSNHAEQHPEAYKFTSRSIEKGGKLLVFDPRFGRTASKAHMFAWFRPGTEAAIVLGIMNYAIRNGLYDKQFLQERTDFPLHHQTGQFLEDWEKNPDSVFSKFKEHVSRFTPEEVERITGVPAYKFLQMAAEYTNPANRPGQFVWCIGATQHTCGTQIIRLFGQLQLLLGNVGQPGGGANVLRGISNVQGSNDMNHLMHIWLGYRRVPGGLGERERISGGAEADIRRYQKYKNLVREGKTAAEIAQALNIAWVGDLRHYASWREAEMHWGIFIGTYPETDPDNGIVISDVPVEPGLTTIEYFREMEAGRIKFIILQGMNPVVSVGNASQVIRGLSSPNAFVVVMDLFLSETAHFADIVLPAASKYENSGSVTNTGHTIQWRHKLQDNNRVVDPYDPQKRTFKDIRSDLWFIDQLFKRLRQKGLIVLPSERFSSDKGVPLAELRRLSNGKNVDELWDYRHPTKRTKPSIEDLDTEPEAFEVSKEIDKTVRIYRGIVGPNGENRMAQRDKTFMDAYTERFKIFKYWGWAWPDNQRNMYDLKEPRDPRGLMALGFNFFKPGNRATFWSSFYARRGRGFAGYYEPAESPDKELVKQYPPLVGDHPYFKELGITPPKGFHPGNKFEAGMVIGTVEEGFNVILTSFRLTEHQHTGILTRTIPWLAEMMPELFVEMSPSLANKLGVKTGDRVKIVSKRNLNDPVVAKVMVTNRVRPLVINGKLWEIIAMPWAYGFQRPLGRPNVITNKLFPDAMDEETGMPETKIALVRVEKA